jgi:uncharacterized protein YciI
MTHILGFATTAAKGKYAERELARKELVVKQQADRIKELEAKIDNFKTAGRSVPKQGSLAGGSSSSVSTKPTRPESLEAAFDMIEAGKL